MIGFVTHLELRELSEVIFRALEILNIFAHGAFFKATRPRLRILHEHRRGLLESILARDAAIGRREDASGHIGSV